MNSIRNRVGRKPKADPKIYPHIFRLTEAENTKMLALFKASGMNNKAKFITSVLFSREIKSVRIDKGSMDFYMRLTSFYTQFRNIGIDYHKVVKVLYHHFSQKEAQALLLKLELQTIELSKLCHHIVSLIKESEKIIHK
ncbi:hypothetical protein J2799_001664 [Chryseobacterium vietnamense]|jgi:hypothetical protein|uniref:conjugal transfer protein MobA n=1 Tax=Chryseobacterium vietnamense TaxID=866785 RepID=UPI00285DE45B|nr:conjugal transfer protein MobA [Chryseobacterium vietnamense]MDR6487179.1 hypothetical protein [Chryseobacterium vietnamense]